MTSKRLRSPWLRLCWSFSVVTFCTSLSHVCGILFNVSAQIDIRHLNISMYHLTDFLFGASAFPFNVRLQHFDFGARRISISDSTNLTKFPCLFRILQQFPAATGWLMIQYFTIDLPPHPSIPLRETLGKQIPLVRKSVFFSHFLGHGYYAADMSFSTTTDLSISWICWMIGTGLSWIEVSLPGCTLAFFLRTDSDGYISSFHMYIALPAWH
jgi:hypothetical protein